LDPAIKESIYKLDIKDAKVIAEYQDIASKYVDKFVVQHKEFLEKFFPGSLLTESTSMACKVKATLGDDQYIFDEL
jgi:hypothetical protein